MTEFNRPPWAALIDVKTASGVIDAISRPRLGAYGISASDSSDVVSVVARHGRNIVVSESLYPLLHLLELVIRNRIHDVFRLHFGSDEWFRQSWVDDLEYRHITKAEDDLKRQRKPLAPDDIVAAVTFGFWVGLFNRRYEPRNGNEPWPRLLKAVVPWAPRYARTRDTLHSRIEKARHVRNRVFHHEPIAHWPDLDTTYTGLVELLGWFSPEAREHLAHLCRFTSVWADELVPAAD